MLIVYTTTSNAAEAEELARKIVVASIAACVQILPQISSIYFWEGKVRKETEHLLVIKTLPEKYDELEKFIIANHPYEIPEIIAVEAARVAEKYLGWLKDYLT